MNSELRKPKVIKRVAELKAIGMSDDEISKAINEEFKINASRLTIARLIKTISTEVIKKDKEFSEVIKKIVLDMVGEVRKNLSMLESSRKLVLDKIEESKGLDQTREVKLLEQYVIDIGNTKDWVVIANKIKDILKIIKAPSFTDNFRMITYIRELNSQIKTQNDSIRTMNEILKRLESQGKETKVSTVQSVQISLSTLKELEKDGLIRILPEYFNSELNSEEKEEENGTEWTNNWTKRKHKTNKKR